MISKRTKMKHYHAYMEYKTRLYRVSDRRFLSVFTTCNLVTWSEKSIRFNSQFFKSVFAITGVYCRKKEHAHDMNLYI